MANGYWLLLISIIKKIQEGKTLLMRVIALRVSNLLKVLTQNDKNKNILSYYKL